MALCTTARAIEIQPALESYSTAEIAAALESVSAAIETRCGRKFGQSTVVDQVIETDQYGYTWLNRPPITAGTFSVKSMADNALGTFWSLNMSTGEFHIRSQPNQFLKVSFQGGFATIPAVVELAASSMALRLLQRLPKMGGIAKYQIGSESVDFQQNANDLFDAAILTILGPYMLGSLL